MDDRRLRVLLLASSADEYGAPKVLVSTVRALINAGIDAVVLFPESGRSTEHVRAAGADAEVIDDFVLRRRYMRLRALPALVAANIRLIRRAIRAHRDYPFSVVYSSTQSVIVGPLLAAIMRARHIWHIHEILVEPRWLAKGLARLAPIGTDVIVCPSKAVADHVAGLAPPARTKLRVVPNSVDNMDELGQLEPPSYRGEMRIGCVGRLHPWKGQELAIEAVARARAAGVPMRLTLFGAPASGNDHIERDLKRLATRLTVDGVVEFAGWEGDPARLYSSVDAVLVASTSPEPFSLACVEAQAAARAVVAPREGGPREIIVDGETGFLVEPRSAQAIADAWSRLWQDTDRARQMGLAGRTAAQRRYTFDAYARRLVEVISPERGLQCSSHS